MFQSLLQTKVLLAILAIVAAFAAFETHLAMEEKARAEALALAHQRFIEKYDQGKANHEGEWGNAAGAISGFRLHGPPQKKGSR